MTAYGTSPLGTDLGPFGGPGLITCLGVLPLGNNSVVVVYDRPPRADDPLGFGSATRADAYVLTPIDPTYTSPTVPLPGVVPAGAAVPTRSPIIVEARVDPDDDTQVVLVSDSLLQPRITYTLLIDAPPCGGGGQSFAGPTEFLVLAPGRPYTLTRATVAEERYRDFAFDDATGYAIDPNGDIGLQDADISLRKRIYRRIFAGRGAYVVLGPSYGLGVKAATLMRPGQLQTLASEAAEQIRQEPDVAAASVDVEQQVTQRGTLLIMTAHVQRVDGRSVRFVYRQPVV